MNDTTKKNRKAVLYSLLTCLGLLAACTALSADRQSAVDEIAKLRSEYQQEIKSLHEEWKDAKSEEARIQADIDKAQLEGNEQLRNALMDTFHNVQAALVSIEARQNQFAANVDGLSEREDRIRAEDAGEKSGAMMEIALALLGGGAASGALQKLTPSRSAKRVEQVATEVGALRAALEAYQESNGVAKEEASSLSNKVSKLEGQLESFKDGLERRGTV
jgi:chromosome segregation ATPase